MQSKRLFAHVFALLASLSLLLSSAPSALGQDGGALPVHLPVVAGPQQAPVPNEVPQTPPTSSALTSPLPITATIVLTGYDQRLHYNPDSGVLFAVSKDERVVAIEGTSILNAYTLADGSDSGWNAVFTDIPATGRTYIAVPDTDSYSMIGMFDGANLVDTLALPTVTGMAWNQVDGYLYADSRLPGSRQDTVAIANTQVVTSINTLGSWQWSDSVFGPNTVDSVNGLVYRHRQWERIVLNSSGIQLRMGTPYQVEPYSSYSEYYENSIVVNKVTGKAYFAGVWRDYNLRGCKSITPHIDNFMH